MAKKKLSDDLELEIESGGVMTMRELREFIKEQKLSPSDLFNKFDLLEDELMKEAVNEKADFELEYRDQEAQRELEKMDKEDKEHKEELNNVDLLPEGSVPVGPEKKQEKKEKSSEDKEGDLLPPGEGGESSEGTEDDHDDENGDLLPS